MLYSNCFQTNQNSATYLWDHKIIIKKYPGLHFYIEIAGNIYFPIISSIIFKIKLLDVKSLFGFFKYLIKYLFK